MRMKVTSLILLLFLSFSGRLFACDCLGRNTVQEETKQVDAVLVGTILNKQIIELIDSTIFEMFPNDTIMRNLLRNRRGIARYDFLIQDFYKGIITKDTLIIYSGLNGGDCGVRFDVSKIYIVYGENETYFGQGNYDPKVKNTFWTYECLRTTLYDQNEIAEIEKFAKKQQLKQSKSNTLVFNDPDISPIFKNGDAGLKKFIHENLRYPKTDECISGKVYVSFTVDTLGNVKDIEIKKGITPSTDKEAIRVVEMLTFIPGVRFGRPVETKMILPISFTIEHKEEK
jgi:TonB family protein